MKQIKVSEIITASCALVILIVSSVYLVRNFSSEKKKPTASKETVERLKPYDDDIDVDTLKIIKEFDDYGSPQPSN